MAWRDVDGDEDDGGFRSLTGAGATAGGDDGLVPLVSTGHREGALVHPVGLGAVGH